MEYANSVSTDGALYLAWNSRGLCHVRARVPLENPTQLGLSALEPCDLGDLRDPANLSLLAVVKALRDHWPDEYGCKVRRALAALPEHLRAAPD